jgi:transposase-like protein
MNVPADAVSACRDCDSSQIQHCAPGAAERYVCRDCGARFTEPVARPRQHDGSGRSGLAARLHDADPEEVRR